MLTIGGNEVKGECNLSIMSFSCMKMHNYSQTKHSLEDKKKRKKEKKA
jgi:hypothetical protein